LPSLLSDHHPGHEAATEIGIDAESLLADYLPRREAAAALGVAPETLSRWKARHFGPPVTRIAGRDYYNKESLRKWLARQERDPAAPEPRRGRARRAHRSAAE
jgi:hypothetical protein